MIAQVWIETGYGLEGFITDGFAGETSRAMVPFFRTGDYGRGLRRGRDARRAAHRRRPQRQSRAGAAAAARKPSGARGGGFPLGFWVILLIIFLNMIGGSGRSGVTAGSAASGRSAAASAAGSVAAGLAAVDSAAAVSAGSAAAAPAAVVVEPVGELEIW